MKKSFLYLYCAMFMLSSCAIQFSSLKPDDTLGDLSNESIIVLGVNPRARVSLFKGKSINGKWQSTGLGNIANVWPDEGFVVLKLKPRMGDTNYGVGQILPTGLGGDSFGPKKGTLIPVFNVPPGQITFVGAIKLIKTAHGYIIENDENVTLEDAKKYLDKKYPNLSKEVKTSKLELQAWNKN